MPVKTDADDVLRRSPLAGGLKGTALKRPVTPAVYLRLPLETRLNLV